MLGFMFPIIIAIVSALILLIISVLFDRFLIPWQAKRTVAKLMKSKKPSNPRILENPIYGTLLPDNSCVQIIGGKGQKFTFQWNEVEEVHAFKRDLFTTDLICLAFKLSEDRFVEINEEMVGYYDLQSWLPKQFSGIQENWIMDVVSPAFKTNHRVLWKNSAN
jgi:hypothetical protein